VALRRLTLSSEEQLLKAFSPMFSTSGRLTLFRDIQSRIAKLSMLVALGRLKVSSELQKAKAALPMLIALGMLMFFNVIFVQNYKFDSLVMCRLHYGSSQPAKNQY